MQNLHNDLLNKTQASEAILGQLLNLQTSSVDSQMLKIILLKRITISILSGLLYNSNANGMKGMHEAIGAGILNLPKSTQVAHVAAIARAAADSQ